MGLELRRRDCSSWEDSVSTWVQKTNRQKFRVWSIKVYIVANLDLWRNGSNQPFGILSTGKFNFLSHNLTKFYLLWVELISAKANEREKAESPSFPSSQSQNLYLMVNLTPAFDMGQWQGLWLMPPLDLWKCFHKILSENALPKKQVN